ncbi:hypothetical protein GCM10009555_095290 [Acrocarpospora macrocephala]|uniref:Uncharacterized protein n=1 Tax=Acrocarpospora macrocephala TaxID=150177 RepID=A0A5M3WLK5_9ACTN|nr:hypothetical protein Amac_031220 [Acrocarpospora macrocephala]
MFSTPGSMLSSGPSPPWGAASENPHARMQAVAVAQRAGFRHVTRIQDPDGTDFTCYARDLK